MTGKLANQVEKGTNKLPFALSATITDPMGGVSVKYSEVATLEDFLKSVQQIKEAVLSK